MLLSVVVPVYNEERRLLVSFPKILEYLNDNFDRDFELIFVDDGSTDRTLAVLHSACKWCPRIKVISYKYNKGKGYAVRSGLREAKGDYILFMDVDLSTDLNCIKNIVNYAETIVDQYQDFNLKLIVIGDRENPQSIVKTSFFRKFIGRFFNRLQSGITGLDINDTQCGFKLMTKNTVKIFDGAFINGFTFDVELLYLAQKNGVPIYSIPVKWTNYPGSKVHPFRDSYLMFIDLVELRKAYG